MRLKDCSHLSDHPIVLDHNKHFYVVALTNLDFTKLSEVLGGRT